MILHPEVTPAPLHLAQILSLSQTPCHPTSPPTPIHISSGITGLLIVTIALKNTVLVRIKVVFGSPEWRFPLTANGAPTCWCWCCCYCCESVEGNER